MKTIVFFLKRIDRYNKYGFESDKKYIVKIFKRWIAFILIILLLYLVDNKGIGWVLDRIALLGLIGGLIWWGNLKIPRSKIKNRKR